MSLQYSARSSVLGVAQVNVATSQVLLVELVFGALGLILTLEEDEGVPSWSALVHVDRNVSLSHSEVLEEVADLTHLDGERKSAHLECLVAVFVVDEVGETNSAANLTATVTTTVTAAITTAITTTITAIATVTTISTISTITTIATIATVTAITTVATVAIGVVESVTVVATIATIVARTTTASATATSTDSTASTATVAGVELTTTTAGTVEIATTLATASMSAILGVLLVLEVVVFVHLDADEFDPPATDVLLVQIGLSLLAIDRALEKDAGLAGKSTVAHLSNLD